ncbi:uncharacterized protein [Antedon mediterranea]|uniref:uncharacterized protein n=1 Tax=Antedon mediterranea TaxID=105859 RepID=UPI003AF946CE
MEISDAEAEWSEEEEVTEEIHSESDHVLTDEEEQDKSKEEASTNEEEEESEFSDESEYGVEVKKVNVDHTDFILDSIDKELNALISQTYPVVQSSDKKESKQSPVSTSQNSTGQLKKRKDRKQRSLESTIDTGLGSGSPEEAIAENMSHRRAMQFAETLLKEESSSPGNQEGVSRKTKSIKLQKKKGTNSIKAKNPPKQNDLVQSLKDGKTLDHSRSLDNQSISSFSSKNKSQKINNTAESFQRTMSPSLHSDTTADYDFEVTEERSYNQVEEEDDVGYSNDGDESLQYSDTEGLSASGKSLVSDEHTLEDIHEIESIQSRNIEDENGLIQQRIHRTLSDVSNFHKKYSKSEKISDNDSMVTIDIMHELDTSFGPQDYPPMPPPSRSSYVYRRSSTTDGSVTSTKLSKRPRRKRSSKQKRSKTVDSGVASEVTSGLPEYMYLKKPVGESDVGTDSIHTEHYEPMFSSALVYIGEGFKPGLTLMKSRLNVPSDVESVQTEDFERRFRNMMVKQVAGVPLTSFDTITIPSDLDSVKSGDVRQTFQTVLKRKKGAKKCQSVESLSNLSDSTSEINNNFTSFFKHRQDLLNNDSDNDSGKGALRYTSDDRHSDDEDSLLDRGIQRITRQAYPDEPSRNKKQNAKKSPGKGLHQGSDKNRTNSSNHLRRQLSRFTTSEESISTFETESLRSQSATSNTESRKGKSFSGVGFETGQWQSNDYYDYEEYGVPEKLSKPIIEYNRPSSSSGSYASSLCQALDLGEPDLTWSVAEWVESSCADRLDPTDNQPQNIDSSLLPKPNYSDFYKEAMSIAKEEQSKQNHVNDISELPLEARYLMEASLGALNPGGMSQMMYNNPVPSEEILMDLGFGGQVTGVPERFMISLRQKQAKVQAEKAKKRAEQVQKMLQRAFNVRLPGQSTSNRWKLSMKTESKGENTDKTETSLSKTLQSNAMQEHEIKQDKRNDNSNSFDVCDVVETDELINGGVKNKGLTSKVQSSTSNNNNNSYLTALVDKRKKLKRAATIGCLDIDSVVKKLQECVVDSNSDSIVQRRKSLPQKIENRKRRDHTSSKERRLKLFRKQHSLPLSLETLPEEDEGQKSLHQSFSTSFEQSVDNKTAIDESEKSKTDAQINTEDQYKYTTKRNSKILPHNFVTFSIATQTQDENFEIIESTKVTQTQTSFECSSGRPSLSSLNETFCQRFDENLSVFSGDQTFDVDDCRIPLPDFKSNCADTPSPDQKEPTYSQTKCETKSESSCNCNTSSLLTYEDTVQNEDEDYGEYFDRILMKITNGRVTEPVEADVDHLFDITQSLDSPTSQHKRLLIPDPGLFDGLYPSSSNSPVPNPVLKVNTGNVNLVPSTVIQERRLGKLTKKFVEMNGFSMGNHLGLNGKVFPNSPSERRQTKTGKMLSRPKKSKRQRKKKQRYVQSKPCFCESMSSNSYSSNNHIGFTKGSRGIDNNHNYSSRLSQKMSPTFNDHSHCCHCPRSCCIVNTMKSPGSSFRLNNNNVTNSDTDSTTSSPYNKKTAPENICDQNSYATNEGINSNFSTVRPSKSSRQNHFKRESFKDSFDTVNNSWLIEDTDDSTDKICDEILDFSSDDSSCPGITRAFSYSMAQHHQTLIDQPAKISNMEIKPNECVNETFRSECFIHVPSYQHKVSDIQPLSSQIYLQLLPAPPLIGDDVTTASSLISTLTLFVNNDSDISSNPLFLELTLI